MTPLYDAIGRIVSRAEADAPEKAVIVIMTDGMENSSTELTNQGAKAALDRARARGWEVVFLGAEFASFDDAEAVGMSASKTMAVGEGAMSGSMNDLAQKARAYGKGAADGQHNADQGEKLAATSAAAWQYAANRFLRLPDRIIYVGATATLAAAAATTAATRRRLAPRARWARIAPGALTATIIVIPRHERRGLQQMNVKNERPKTGRDASSGKPTPI
jgi:hypothetical protein